MRVVSPHLGIVEPPGKTKALHGAHRGRWEEILLWFCPLRGEEWELEDMAVMVGGSRQCEKLTKWFITYVVLSASLGKIESPEGRQLDNICFCGERAKMSARDTSHGNPSLSLDAPSLQLRYYTRNCSVRLGMGLTRTSECKILWNI